MSSNTLNIIELGPNKPRVPTPHKVILSVELRLKRSNWKARHTLQTYRPIAWLRENTNHDKNM